MSRVNAARVEVYDGTGGGHVLVRNTNGPSSRDVVANNAYDNGVRFLDYISNHFQRNSWDDRGSVMKLVVHAPDPGNGGAMNNAYWDSSSRSIYFGDGDGMMFAPLGNAADVVAHEAGHSIVDSEVKLVYSGQQGGLHESWADVFGTLVDGDDWLIGEDVFTPGKAGDALRDMQHPLYRNMNELPKGTEVDVHYLSGIPNLAAARAAGKVGREKMGQIWYYGLKNNLHDNANFSEAARATVEAARQLYGDNSKECNAVRDAWESVGVLKPQAKPKAIEHSSRAENSRTPSDRQAPRPRVHLFDDVP
jgi:Zn-dependent metalloprotease